MLLRVAPIFAAGGKRLARELAFARRPDSSSGRVVDRTERRRILRSVVAEVGRKAAHQLGIDYDDICPHCGREP